MENDSNYGTRWLLLTCCDVVLMETTPTSVSAASGTKKLTSL